MSSRNRANGTIQILLCIIILLLVGIVGIAVFGHVSYKKAQDVSGQLELADEQYAKLQEAFDQATADNISLQSTVDDQNTTISELQEEILDLRSQLEGQIVVEDSELSEEESYDDLSASESDKSKSSSEKESSSSSSEKTPDEDIQPEEQEQLPAPVAVQSGHSYTDAAGNSATFTNDEWNYLISVWAYTGNGEEMISHHSVGELRQVLSAR